MQVFLHTLFLESQQKRGEISARQFSTRINELACKVWSCLMAMFDFSKKSTGRSCTLPFNYNLLSLISAIIINNVLGC